MSTSYNLLQFLPLQFVLFAVVRFCCVLGEVLLYARDRGLVDSLPLLSVTVALAALLL